MFNPVLRVAQKIKQILPWRTSQKAESREKVIFESLENRILLSADLPVNPADNPDLQDVVLEAEHETIAPESEESRQDINAEDGLKVSVNLAPEITTTIPENMDSNTTPASGN